MSRTIRKTRRTRLIALLLAASMICANLPLSALAVDTAATTDTTTVVEGGAVTTGDNAASDETVTETNDVNSVEPAADETVAADEALSLEEQANNYLASAPMTMSRSVSIPADFIGGAANPFKISSASALQELAELVNNGATYSMFSYADACYQLVAAIDLGDTEWTAISGFRGSFDGNGDDYPITSSVIEVVVATDGKIGLFAADTANITDVGIKYTGGVTEIPPSGGDTWASHAATSFAKEGEISSAAELAYFAKQVNAGSITDGTYTLTKDIDLSAYEWVAIGATSNQFEGTFNGNNCTITGLYINNTESMQGLFGYIDGGTVQNLHVSGSLTSTANIVGGIVGNAVNAKVENCSFSGSVTSTHSTQSYAGGIVGQAMGTCSITACDNTGNVTGAGMGVGGIVGGVDRVEVSASSSVTITQCYNTGAISAAGDNAGGIVGGAMYPACSVTITQCYNTGAISAAGDNAGGIVGYVKSNAPNKPSSVKHCYNTGNISGSNYVGGVLGKDDNNTSTITTCYNTGNISGTVSWVGGIGGSKSESLTKCVSLANSVKGFSYVGYLIGDSDLWDSAKGNDRWSGTTLTGSTQNTDGTVLYYSTVDGLTTDEAGTTAFSWAENGFTSDNGWTIPSGDDANVQLPSLTAVSADIPQNPLSNLSVVTITFEDAEGTTKKTISGENSVVVAPADAPTDDIWCYVNPYTNEIVNLTFPLTRTVDTTFILYSTIASGIVATVTVSNTDMREYLTLSDAVGEASHGFTVTLLKDYLINEGEELGVYGATNLETGDYTLTVNGTLKVQDSVVIDKVTVGDGGAIEVSYDLKEAARIGVTNISGNIGSATTRWGGVYTLSNSNFYVVGHDDNATSYADSDTLTDVIVDKDGTLRIADFIYKKGVTVLRTDEDENENDIDYMVYDADLWFEKLPADTTTTLAEAGAAITTDNYKNAGYYILVDDDTSALRTALLDEERETNIYLHLNGREISDKNMTVGDSNSLTVFGGTISRDITLAQHSILQLFGGTISGTVSSSFGTGADFLTLGTFTGALDGNVEMKLGGNAQLGTTEHPYQYDGNSIDYGGGGIYALTDAAKLYIDLSAATDGDVLAVNVESETDTDGSLFLNACEFTNGDGFAKTYSDDKIILTGMTVDQANKTIYANGYRVVIIDGTDGTSTVFWDANVDGSLDDGEIIVKENADLSDWTIYGGSKTKELNLLTNVSICGGNVGTVYVGGQNSGISNNRGCVNVWVTGDCETDIYMTNGGNDAPTLTSSTLTIYQGNLTGEVITEATGDNTLSVGLFGDATVTIHEEDYYGLVKNNAKGTIYWDGGVVNTLCACDGSTTNLNFDLSNTEVKVCLYDNNNQPITALTKAIQFITLGEDGAYDEGTFSLYGVSSDVEITSSQLVQSGNALYYAPLFTADIALASDAQYASTTTATVTLSNQALGEGVIASKATIYAVGENGTDVAVGKITVQNGTTVYENVAIDLTDENISVDSDLKVKLYVVFGLATGVTAQGGTTLPTIQYSVAPKSATGFTVEFATDTKVYDGTVFEPAVTVYYGEKAIASEYYTVTYSNDAAVGEKEVSIAFNTLYTGTLTEKIEITAATPTITVSIADWTYGDAASTPEFTTSGEYTSATYTYSDRMDGTYTSEVPTNAGTYYVKATVAATQNYTSATSEAVRFEIKQKALTATLATDINGYIPMKSYDGTKLFENLSLDLVGVLADDVAKVTATATGNSASADVNASATGYVFTATTVVLTDATGNYTLSASAVSGNVSIQPVSTDITLEIAQSSYVLDEDVVLQAATTTKDVKSGDYVAGTVTFYDGDTFIGTAAIDTSTGIASYTYQPNLGTYKIRVVFTPDDDTNYNGANHGTITFDVVKKANEVVFSDPSAAFTYGDTVSFETSVVSDKEATLEYKRQDEEDSDYTDAVPTQVGMYMVRASVAEDEEYFSAQATYAFEITPKELLITPDAFEKFYGQADDVFTYTYSGNLTGETPAFTGVLAREGGESIGHYPITSGSLELSDTNYTMKIDNSVMYEIKEYTTDAQVADLAGWQCVDTITLTAPEGYAISTTNGVKDAFANSLTIDTQQGESVGVKYYLRSTSGQDVDAISTTKTFTYSNDQIAPSGTITLNKSVWDKFLETITFGIYEAKYLQVSITAQDAVSGVATTEYYVASEAKTLVELEASTAWTAYGIGFTIPPGDEVKTVVYAKLVDNVGNVTYLSSNGVIFDITAPIISGIINNGYYASDLSIEVSDTNLDKVTLNGNAVEPAFQLDYGVDETYTLVATDKAGNTTSMVFHMYTKNVPVEDVLDNLPTIDENATETEKESIKEEIKETVNNLVESYLEELKKTENPDTEEPETENPDAEGVIIDKVNKLDEVLVEENPTISVVGVAKIVDESIPEDKRAPEAEIIPQGLAVAIFGSDTYIDNISTGMALSLSVAQTAGDEDGLVFDVKPMVSVAGQEATVISNSDLSAPVTFRLYLNNSFKGTVASVEHVKEDGSSEFNEQKTLYQDTHGNYINLSAYEFSTFIVREYTYAASVDGVSATYKAGNIVTLVTPTKDGYQFAGWVCEGIATSDIADGMFAMPENDVVVTSSWEKLAEEPDAQEDSNEENSDTQVAPQVQVEQDVQVESEKTDVDSDSNSAAKEDANSETVIDEEDANSDVSIDEESADLEPEIGKEDTDVQTDADSEPENVAPVKGNANKALWITLVCVSLAGAFGVIYLKRKKNQETNENG